MKYSSFEDPAIGKVFSIYDSFKAFIFTPLYLINLFLFLHILCVIRILQDSIKNIEITRNIKFRSFERSCSCRDNFRNWFLSCLTLYTTNFQEWQCHCHQS